MDPVLEVKHLSQEYPGVKALDDVSLSIYPGEVLALVGENGAGKSTLIRSLAGVEKPVAGEILLHGNKQDFKNSADSQNAGIAVVNQEFRLVSELTVYENIFLGHEITKYSVINRRQAKAKAQKVLDTLGLHLDLDRFVSSLTVGDQQLVEIARSLSRKFNILIMDEPTAALNDSEIMQLHAIVRNLKQEGKSIIYVSHHLEEIFQICDRVAVLRNGKLVHTCDVTETSESDLVEHMLGRKPEVFNKDGVQINAQREVLHVKNISVAALEDNISFTLHEGEILGLAGLVGSGRSELCRALFGQIPINEGSIEINGKRIHLKNNRDAIRSGIYMLSEDRKNEGIIPHLDVTENAMISKDKKTLGILERMMPLSKKENTLFENLKKKMHIKVRDNKQLITGLSGGNQQKVLFARAALSGCSVLILNEPTRGVDVGAKVEIYELIKSLAHQGVSVIVSSSDAPELATLVDRCIVLFAGKQTAEFLQEDVNEDNIIAASVGSLSR